MKYALIVAGLLASTAASATNINSPVSQSTAGAAATAGASAAAGAVSGSRSSVTNSVRNNVSNRVSNRQGQIQGQGQAQQAQSNNAVTVTGDRNINAPGFGGFASGPCTGVGGQVSVGVAGFGGGAGFTALDESCTKRELARVLLMMGEKELAMDVLMLDPTVKAAISSRGKTPESSSGFCSRWPSDAYCKKD